MDDHKLHTLLSVVETGSFSKAAQIEHCTQSAVTQMMNALEEELGFTLLLRSHNGTTLTAEGSRLLPYISKASDSLRKLKEQADSIKEGRTRPIMLGAFSSIANSWLPVLMQRYQALHPEVGFDIRVSTRNLGEWLKNGEIDIALGDEIRCRVGRHWHQLGYDPYYAVLPTDWVRPNQKCLTHEELAAFTLIVAPENFLGPYFKVLAKKKISVSCDDDTTLFSMVAQKMGVTAMPRLSLRNIPDNITLLELDPQPQRRIGIALSEGASKAAQKFLEFVKEEYPRLAR